MTTFLLAWNPRRFQWGDLHVELNRLRRGGSARDAWTVGSSTLPRSGDRFFLIRLGEPPRGIVASGKITSSPYEADHWDQDRASKGDKARYVGIDFDVLSEEPLIEWSTLMEPPLSGFRWATQMSGIRLPLEVASAVEELWSQATAGSGVGFPDERSSLEAGQEGARQQVWVNRYERNPRLRAACIEHYGLSCVVCGMSFERRYGPVAATYIQVHHLDPLSNVAGPHEVDPIEDLRPVCPNCHAVIHLRGDLPYSIEEVKQFLSKSGAAAPPESP